MPFDFLRSTVTWFRILIGILVIWFVAAFWYEFGMALRALLALLQAIFTYPNINVPPEGAFESLWVLVFNVVIGFGFVTVLWLFLIASQAMLPVETFEEVWRTAWHLGLHILGMHGQAVFVEGGEVKATIDDYQRSGPGVVVVDFNSAVVLEERIQPPSMLGMFANMIYDGLRLLNLSDPYINSRACGPGIEFTRPNERIRGVVDLRKQSRFQPDVSGYTRNGIELITKGVFVVFSASEQPERLQVTYQGGYDPENLRVVQVKEDEYGNVRITADASADELDAADRMAIHNRFQVLDEVDWCGFEMLPPPRKAFKEDRIFDVVSSTAFSEDEVQPWDKLPTEVAANEFREIILQYDYDDLYKPDSVNPNDFPMRQVKDKFKLAVRNNGLLSYRLIRHSSKQDLVADGVYGRYSLETSEVFALPVSPGKVLRERGINIIAAGFLDLKPEAEEVIQQRLDSWRSTWQRETEETRAPYEYKVMRTRDQARIQAQQSLVNDLSRILNTANAEEVLALRILQALESAAADPDTKKMLPTDTIKLINHVHDWLLDE